MLRIPIDVSRSRKLFLELRWRKLKGDASCISAKYIIEKGKERYLSLIFGLQ
jgi:hypothetical protein